MRGIFSMALLLCTAMPNLLLAQSQGQVVNNNGEPIPGVAVYPVQQINQGTTSDSLGNFNVAAELGITRLVFRYVGYKTDTLLARQNMRVTLQSGAALNEVEIVKRQQSTRIHRMDPLKTEQIGEKELLKAACCNLSESFETSPSIDVSFTDAVTGTRQIQLLGLAGPYTQFTRENMPVIRGIDAVHGLEFVPGTWMQSIQLNKGAGSVVNGFESMVGQINYELRKPLDSDKFYLNLYANQGGRMEANVHATTAVSNNLATALLVHGKSNQMVQDRNSDGFYDMPLSDHFIALNRWFLMGNNGWRFQWGGKITQINLHSGQIASSTQSDENFWKLRSSVQAYSGFAKAGKVFDLPWKSLGFQLSYHNQQEATRFGFEPVRQPTDKDYRGTQFNLYFNSIYQSIIGNTNNTFKTGLSLQGDVVEETLTQAVARDFKRNEWVPGAFFELNKIVSEKFKVVGGVRGDYHNQYGFFMTPRVHTWWQAAENTFVRASAGRGLRTANVIAENLGELASTRFFSIQSNPTTNTPYGLDAEIAWNYGLNLTQYAQLWERDLQLALDFYRTDFQNQIVVDRYSNSREVRLYNLQGSSFANSFQGQVDYEVFPRFDLRVAYRWYDVQTTYEDQLLPKPFLAQHRAFINLAYETDNRWFFDATLNWTGQQDLAPRINETPGIAGQSPSFFQLNGQVRKVWAKHFEVYVGVENALDFRMDVPIYSEVPARGLGQSASAPAIDAASVWGPIFGRNIYVGLRWRIP